MYAPTPTYPPICPRPRSTYLQYPYAVGLKKRSDFVSNLLRQPTSHNLLTIIMRKIYTMYVIIHDNFLINQISCQYSRCSKSY